MTYRIFMICVLMVMAFSQSVYAQRERPFTIYLNDNPVTYSQNVSPCFPVMARFEHPNPKVTQVRMRYPRNWSMYRIYGMGQDVGIDIHENFMRDGVTSYSDFIAEDAQGNQYGTIQLTFVPIPADQYEDLCHEYLNS